MNPSELIGFVVVIGAAVVAALTAAVGLGVALHLQRLTGHWVAVLTVPMLAAGIGGSSLLSGRDLRYAATHIDVIAIGDGGGATWPLRLLTALLVGLSVASIVARLFAPRSSVAARGRPLAWAFVLYTLCNSILNSLFGTVPAFSHNSLYVPIVFLAVFMARDEDPRPMLQAALWAVAALMLASLAAAMARPNLAMQPDYRGWIPGLHARLWGVGSNPNSIGPLAVLLLLLLHLQPPARRWLRWGAAASAWAVLVLAQSKTAWAAGLACAALLLWNAHAFDAQARVRTGAVLVCVALASLGVLLLLTGVGSRFVDKLMASQAGADITTLTGRVQIWSAAVAAWRDNPLFGYGPSAWGPAHRAAIGLPFAFSAHNQAMQALSVAGSLGLGSLLLFVIVLGRYAWQARSATRGVSLALLVFVLLRCVTEAPLTVNTLFNGDTLALLVLFRLSLAGVPKVERSIAAQRFKRLNRATVRA